MNPVRSNKSQIYADLVASRTSYGMNLLIITQKVDESDDLLGFFIDWINCFSSFFENIYVICLYKGSYNLPSNVKVFSLGKEKNRSKILYLRRFYKLIWQYRSNYQCVFVHMNPLYVVLGGLCWRMLGKTISLWYAHGHVSPTLKLAEKLAHLVFTSTPEGFRLRSNKTRVVGQGINVDRFCPIEPIKDKPEFQIITVGRIAPSKDYETLIHALAQLKNNLPFRVKIIGGVSMAKDKDYLEKILSLIDKYGLKKKVELLGSLPNSAVVSHLQSADCFVNMGLTGSLDKAVLEAMACGLVVLTCNEALAGVLGPYADELMYPKRDAVILCQKLKMIGSMSPVEKSKLANSLRDIVVKHHNLDGLIEKISGYLNVPRKI